MKQTYKRYKLLGQMWFDELLGTFQEKKEVNDRPTCGKTPNNTKPLRR